jgi:DNA invertase Pin-like site-specific DNA recombinase
LGLGRGSKARGGDRAAYEGKADSCGRFRTADEVGKAGAGFKSLKDTWADTTTPHGRLMLTVLGGLAEFERELIRARTDDGRTRAKARGVKFGRPVKLTAHQRKEAIQRLAEGAVQADLARSYGVSQARGRPAIVSDDFARWLEDNPPPDLQKLVRRAGERIPN